MTHEVFAQRMEEIVARAQPGHPERNCSDGGHEDADDLLCEVLKGLGYDEGLKVYGEIVRWFE